jgi:hypothetical protein
VRPQYFIAFSKDAYRQNRDSSEIRPEHISWNHGEDQFAEENTKVGMFNLHLQFFRFSATKNLEDEPQ